MKDLGKQERLSSEKRRGQPSSHTTSCGIKVKVRLQKQEKEKFPEAKDG